MTFVLSAYPPWQRYSISIILALLILGMAWGITKLLWGIYTSNNEQYIKGKAPQYPLASPIALWFMKASIVGTWAISAIIIAMIIRAAIR